MPKRRFLLFSCWFLASLPRLALAEWNPGSQPDIDYRAPARPYERQQRGDAVLFIEKQFLDEEPGVAQRAIERFYEKRSAALTTLPESARQELGQIPFYLMYGPKARGGGRSNGLRYFPKNAPDHHPELAPEWRNVIVISSGENYVKISEFWAEKAIVHELSHARQLLHHAPSHPTLLQAWKSAMDKGLYKNVVDEEGKFHETAYPRVNQLEYFAELSTMYFYGCNYFPHSRAELEGYDPDGLRVVRELWGLSP